MSGHIVVVGSLNMDLVVRASRLPKMGESVIGGSFATFPGGKGANQAVAAARLEAQVKMIGRVGADPNGEVLLRTLSDAGVDTSRILRDPQSATGVALITVDESGHNTIVIALGANGRVSPDDLDAQQSVFDGAGALVLQLECPQPAVDRAVQLASARGVPVVFNPAPARPLDPQLLKMVDYLIPNETELYLLSGRDDLQSGVAQLQSLGARRVIVTLGEQGVLLAEDSHQERIPAFKVTAVDTTAAGDAFVAAFAVALVEGRPLPEAVTWGSAAGALAVTKMGAQPSLPWRSELLAFLESKPARLTP